MRGSIAANALASSCNVGADVLMATIAQLRELWIDRGACFAEGQEACGPCHQRGIAIRGMS
jgi:hypothetical protein